VIDTSALNVHELRRKIDGAFGPSGPTPLSATVVSFGFKYGIPVDADVVVDVRFLPNPHWDPNLRALTGRDDPVREAVLGQAEAGEFLDRTTALLDLTRDLALMPREDCRVLHDAYFAYRAEVHRCALQEVDGLVDDTSLVTHRSAVAAVWQRLMFE
jgi:RNase adaptor protein for sRNA GlmZ degradation